MSQRDVTLVLHFNAKWLPGLNEFQASESLTESGMWGIHAIPNEDGSTTLVSGNNSRCCIIRDPETRLGGDHGGKPLTFVAPPEMVEVCSRDDMVEMADPEGGAWFVPQAYWQLPDDVTILAMGMERPQTEQSCSWWVSPKGVPPGTGDDGPLLAKGHISIGAVHHGRKLPPWETLMGRPSGPVERMVLPAGQVAGLEKIGQIPRFEFHGGRSSVEVTWPWEAPEATVFISPCDDDAIEANEEEQS